MSPSELERFLPKVAQRSASECWLWTASTNGAGYGQFGVKRDGQHRLGLAHRLSYEYFVGPIPKGMCVCHRCDTPACVNPNHLFLGTKRENNRDMAVKLRHGKKKLTPEAVSEIRRLAADGVTKATIARRFGIGWSTVHNVLVGNTWAHAID